MSLEEKQLKLLEVPIQLEESTDPIIGFRTWLITKDHRSIRSLLDYREYPWKHLEKYESHCNGILSPGFAILGTDSHDLESVPEFNCTCGVYAFDSLSALIKERRQAGGVYLVYGQVSLWGKVIPHSRGYRGQYAYPYGFYDLPSPEHYTPINIKSLADCYGVDVLTPPKELLDYVQKVNKGFSERASLVRERMRGDSKWPTSKI